MLSSGLGRPLAERLGSLAIAIAVLSAMPGLAEEPPTRHGESAITCTNPHSGTTWQIKIDYDRATVDSNAARISDTAISWRDASTGWNYALDRKTGNLTITIASATGGNFLYDRCKLDN